jgi:hypothetical protein
MAIHANKEQTFYEQPRSRSGLLLLHQMTGAALSRLNLLAKPTRLDSQNLHEHCSECRAAVHFCTAVPSVYRHDTRCTSQCRLHPAQLSCSFSRAHARFPKTVTSSSAQRLPTAHRNHWRNRRPSPPATLPVAPTTGFTGSAPNALDRDGGDVGRWYSRADGGHPRQASR